MSGEMIEFRQSQIEDLDQIVRIAEDAKAFLRSSGVSQWQRGTYPDRELFASDVANGIGYVLAEGDRVSAVCAVTFGGVRRAATRPLRGGGRSARRLRAGFAVTMRRRRRQNDII